MGRIGAVSRTQVALLVAALLAIAALTFQWITKISPFSLLSMVTGNGIASAPSCELRDGSGLKDEVFFVSCGGFF